MVMRRELLRAVAAALVGGAGVATAAAIGALPAGAGHGKPWTLLGDVLGSALFWLVLPLTAVVIAALLSILSRSLARHYPASRASALWTLEPLAWGLGLPVLALVVDPWSYSGSSSVLGFTGLALGVLASAHRHRRLRSDAAQQQGELPAKGSLGARFFFVSAAIALPTFMAAMGPSWWPALSGDEPHYLLYARSIWVEGDIDLGADYLEGAYRSFYTPDLPPHTKPGFDPATRYSTHGIGMAILLVPWYAIGSGLAPGPFTLLVRFAMSLWLGAFALVLYELLGDIAGARAARCGALLVVLTGPLIFLAPHLFPDLPALALSAAAYLVLRRGTGTRGALCAGLLIGLLPWLGLKFFAMFAALAAVGVVMLVRSERASALRISGFLGPIVASAAGHAAFTWILYHRISPLAIYHGGSATGLRPVGISENLLDYVLDFQGTMRAGIGLLIDQRHGLLMVAPHYLLAVAGFAWLWRRRRSDFWCLLVVFLAHWGAHAVSQEMGGWSPPARPMVGALWTLAIPTAVGLAVRPSEGRAGSLFSGIRALLAAAGVSITALLLLQPHLLYHDFGVRYSLLLQRYGAPGLPLWKLFPLWVHVEDPQWLISVLWLIAVLVVAGFLWRSSGRLARASGSHPSTVSHRVAQLAFVVLAAGLLVREILVPVTGLHRPHAYGDVLVWTADTLIEEAWAEPDGVWVRGESEVALRISSDRPIASIRAEVSALRLMEATVQLGVAREYGLVRPGSPVLLALDPGRGRRWQEQYFYLLGIDAPRGVSPADLGTDAADRRLLGLYLRILEVRSSP